jgi:hypothetical protein
MATGAFRNEVIPQRDQGQRPLGVPDVYPQPPVVISITAPLRYPIQFSEERNQSKSKSVLPSLTTITRVSGLTRLLQRVLPEVNDIGEAG